MQLTLAIVLGIRPGHYTYHFFQVGSIRARCVFIYLFIFKNSLLNPGGYISVVRALALAMKDCGFDSQSSVRSWDARPIPGPSPG